VDSTFNRISIDGDQSTSDSVVLLSSAAKPSVEEEEFEKALRFVCWKLAEDVVRNGEGTCHVMKVSIKGASNAETATGVGKAIVNSPLIKTAVFGNDPNVGRIVSALGDYMGSLGQRLDPESVSISMGETSIFEDGFFNLDMEKEDYLAKYLVECAQDPSEEGYPSHDKTVDISIRIGKGKAESVVLGSDLTLGYIKENAEYRS
jgi:glutamate N-acetyltransferase/amino-acid N-acetyltransferase